MSSVISLHSVVCKNKWNVNEIKNFLERDSSSVNEMNDYGETPLLCILQKETCSAEVVSLLLKFGADINCTDYRGRTSLNIALEFSRNAAVIRVLVENGVDVKVEPIYAQSASTLCFALRCGASKDVIQLLLDAGCSLSGCWKHLSAIHCAVHFPLSRIKHDVFQLLIERGADMRAVDRNGRTLLCSALRNGNKASTIQLLIAAGGSLDACSKHAYPLFCATECICHTIPLTAEVVKLLLRSGARVDECNDMGQTPLMWAIRSCECEQEAIKLLLQGVDPNSVVDKWDNSLLHVAVRHFLCKSSVVKLLIKHGFQVNKRKQTVLNLAVKNAICEPRVIKTLLENGAEVNKEDKYSETPLIVAVNYWQNSNILKELLSAGALITTDYDGWPLLKKALWQCECSEERLVCFKLLLRYFFLETSQFQINKMVQGHEYSKALLRFRNKCKRELQKMKSTNVGEDVTLHEFLSEYASPQVGCKLSKKPYDFDQLLKAIAGNAYPLYFDIIAAKVSRSSIENKLQEVLVYAEKFSHDKPRMEKICILDYASVCNINQYLGDEDSLRLILAFYNMINYSTGESNKEKNIEDKRIAELTEQSCKRPKLH